MHGSLPSLVVVGLYERLGCVGRPRLGLFDMRFISEVPTKVSDTSIHRVRRQCAGHHGRIDRIAGAPARGDLPA